MKIILGAIETYKKSSKIPVEGSGDIQKKLVDAGQLGYFLSCPGGLIPYPPPANFWMTANRIIPDNLEIKLFDWSISSSCHNFCLEHAGCYSVAPGATYTFEVSSQRISVSCPYHGSGGIVEVGKDPDVVAAKLRFTRDSNGVITDSFTNLQWLEGADKVMNWNETQTWITGLGNGWRPPTRDELKGIYIADSTRRDVHDTMYCNSPSPVLLKLDPTFLLDRAKWVWGEPRDASTAWHFDFSFGKEDWNYRDSDHWALRAFAVRSRR
ncbi:MAG: DUF1566 domain-containing protein [Candidatus Riflebacteria bacterium]|nr:DUF1566 domain-containing protein [Candidatus Riflebacteria bacterium]